MRLYYENIKDEDIVWACAFENANSKSGRLLANLTPLLCMVDKKYRYEHYIIPYSKKGDLLKSKEKSISSYYNGIVFFDNKEECIQYYNDRIKERIDELASQIDRLQHLIIEAK